jgi:hypothetical protein
MAETYEEINIDQLECCPVMERKPTCDVLDLRYRLPFLPTIEGDRKGPVSVDVIIHFRLERCSGPLVLGDPAYTTTLLPGEQVRIFSSDRHSRWSYDSESQLAYRHETTSEESFYTWNMAQAMSDLTITQSGSAVSTFEESWASGGGGAGFNLFGIIEIGGGGGGGSYDAASTSSFLQSLSRHAEASSSQVAAGVRAKSSTSIGEVERRTHAEGESESHLESASRIFKNPNLCHAITFLFYKINKIQKIRFRLVAIERRVNDPTAPTEADRNIVPDTTGMVAVKPQAILATDKNRLEVERTARESVIERQRAALSFSGVESIAGLRYKSASRDLRSGPIDADLREKAIAVVDRDLSKMGLIDGKTGQPTKEIIASLSWDREELIPTPGFVVKGCIDECSICEPLLIKERELELERKQQEIALLKRQIELLGKSQEYRCCPAGYEESGIPE